MTRRKKPTPPADDYADWHLSNSRAEMLNELARIRVASYSNKPPMPEPELSPFDVPRATPAMTADGSPPASGPNSAASASLKSPVEMPFR